MSKIKVLVTGGAGFIGSHITEQLLDKDYEVIVLDDFSTGKRENLNEHENLEIIEGSVTNKELVNELVKKVDLICHQAAIVSVSETINDPIKSHEVSVDGTLNIFEAARLKGIKRIVFASSAAVYGNCENLPVKEDETLRPESPYGLHKKINEDYANLYNKLYGLEIIALRYFNVYGERQSLEGGYPAVIPNFIKKIVNDEEIVIYGNGEQTRDFIYVKDVAEANIKALEGDFKEEGVFNIGNSEEISINNLVKEIEDVLSKKAKVKYDDKRVGDIDKSFCDNLNAKNYLNFEPKISLKEGLKYSSNYYNQ